MMKVVADIQKNEAELQRNVILNAILNSQRKKGTSFIELFKSSNKEKNKEEIIKEREELFSDNKGK